MTDPICKVIHDDVALVCRCGAVDEYIDGEKVRTVTDNRYLGALLDEIKALREAEEKLRARVAELDRENASLKQEAEDLEEASQCEAERTIIAGLKAFIAVVLDPFNGNGREAKKKPQDR